VKAVAVSIILWSRVQAPAGPPDKKTNPSSGWSFFAYSRVLARVRAGSCGLRRFPRAPGLAGFHSLRAILLSGLAVRWRPKSTSAPNWPLKNQQLIGGPIKRLIRGIGRRRKQRRYSGEREMREGLLLAGSFRLGPAVAPDGKNPGQRPFATPIADQEVQTQRKAVLPKQLSAFREGAPKGKAVLARCIIAPSGRFQRQTRLPSTMRQGPATTSFSGATTTSFFGATTTSLCGATTTSFAGSATGLRTSTAPSRPTHPP